MKTISKTFDLLPLFNKLLQEQYILYNSIVFCRSNIVLRYLDKTKDVRDGFTAIKHIQIIAWRLIVLPNNLSNQNKIRFYIIYIIFIKLFIRGFYFKKRT